jgi:hypothetical protein
MRATSDGVGPQTHVQQHVQQPLQPIALLALDVVAKAALALAHQQCRFDLRQDNSIAADTGRSPRDLTTGQPKITRSTFAGLATEYVYES